MTTILCNKTIQTNMGSYETIWTYWNAWLKQWTANAQTIQQFLKLWNPCEQQTTSIKKHMGRQRNAIALMRTIIHPSLKTAKHNLAKAKLFGKLCIPKAKLRIPVKKAWNLRTLYWNQEGEIEEQWNPTNILLSAGSMLKSDGTMLTRAIATPMAATLTSTTSITNSSNHIDINKCSSNNSNTSRIDSMSNGRRNIRTRRSDVGAISATQTSPTAATARAPARAASTKLKKRFPINQFAGVTSCGECSPGCGGEGCHLPRRDACLRKQTTSWGSPVLLDQRPA